MQTPKCSLCSKDMYKYIKVIYDDEYEKIINICKKCYMEEEFILFEFFRKVNMKDYYMNGIKIEFNTFIEVDEIELQNTIYCNHLEFFNKRYNSTYFHKNGEENEASYVFRNIDNQIYSLCNECIHNISINDLCEYLLHFGCIDK